MSDGKALERNKSAIVMSKDDFLKLHYMVKILDSQEMKFEMPLTTEMLTGDEEIECAQLSFSETERAMKTLSEEAERKYRARLHREDGGLGTILKNLIPEAAPCIHPTSAMSWWVYFENQMKEKNPSDANLSLISGFGDAKFKGETVMDQNTGEYTLKVQFKYGTPCLVRTDRENRKIEFIDHDNGCTTTVNQPLDGGLIYMTIDSKKEKNVQCVFAWTAKNGIVGDWSVDADGEIRTSSVVLNGNLRDYKSGIDASTTFDLKRRFAFDGYVRDKNIQLAEPNNEIGAVWAQDAKNMHSRGEDALVFRRSPRIADGAKWVW